MTKRLIFYIVCILWTASPVWAKTITVGVGQGACGGNDCDFTQLAVAVAHEGTTAGDTIQVWTDTTETTRVNIVDDNLTIVGMGSSKPIIDFRTNTCAYGIYCGNFNLTVSNLHIRMSTATNVYNGIRFRPSSPGYSIILNNITVETPYRAAFYIYPNATTASATLTDCTVIGSGSSGSLQHGIAIGDGSTVQISGTTDISNCTTGYGISISPASDMAIQLSISGSVSIDGCTYGINIPSRMTTISSSAAITIKNYTSYGIQYSASTYGTTPSEASFLGTLTIANAPNTAVYIPDISTIAATLRIDNAAITTTTATAISNASQAGTITLNNATIATNSATVFNLTNTGTISASRSYLSTTSGNIAIVSSSGTLELTNCFIEGSPTITSFIQNNAGTIKLTGCRWASSKANESLIKPYSTTGAWTVFLNQCYFEPKHLWAFVVNFPNNSAAHTGAISYCIVKGDSASLSALASINSGHLDVYNTTIASTGGGILIANAAVTTTIKNCIFYDIVNYDYYTAGASPTVTQNHNCHYSTQSSHDISDNNNLKNAVLAESTNIFSNPQLSAPGMVLSKGSPCIDTGTNMGTNLKYGLWAKSYIPSHIEVRDQTQFGKGWEIGAYVFTRKSLFPVFPLYFEVDQ